MSKTVVGLDLGSWTFKISAYSDGHFQVLTNEANFRETPSLVAFHEA
jgi:molecular chaperone DnaK (HSP70)